MAHSPENVIEAAEARRMEDFITSTYSSRREYMTEYMSKLDRVDDFLDGRWVVEFGDGRKVVDSPKIENDALTKIEDTGLLAGNIIPSISVEPLHERDVKPAEKRERILRYYWQNSEVGLLLPRLFMDAVGTGMYGIKVWPDFQIPKDERFPIFTRVDPRTILPPLDHAMEIGR